VLRSVTRANIQERTVPQKRGKKQHQQEHKEDEGAAKKEGVEHPAI